MKRVLAILLCAFVLTGCGRAADRRAAHDVPVPPPATTTTTGATTSTGVGSGGTGKTGTDTDIATTDGLLNQLDSQVNADAQPAQDAD
jgi:hypothetical protein